MQNKTASFKLITDNNGKLRYQFFCDLSGSLEYTSKPINKNHQDAELGKIWSSEAKEHFNYCKKCGKWINGVTFNADVLECVACAPWEEAPNFCPRCGKKVDDTENKCPYCGKSRRYDWGNKSMTEVHEKIRHESMKLFGFGPEAMKAIKVCGKCGKKVNSELLFCTDCDSPLPPQTLYMLYVHNHFVCTKCKTVVSSKYKYCPQCGKQLIFD